MACGEKWKQQAQYGGDFIEHARGPLHAGITKREYFAGLAMQGLCSAMMDERARDFVISRAKEFDCEPKRALAKISVQYTDALLAELERAK